MLAAPCSTLASTSLASMSISSIWALAAIALRWASVHVSMVPLRAAWSSVFVGVIAFFSSGTKTPMAWAAERFDQRHAIGEKESAGG
jgi:hypothetical protein